MHYPQSYSTIQSTLQDCVQSMQISRLCDVKMAHQEHQDVLADGQFTQPNVKPNKLKESTVATTGRPKAGTPT